ncbi:MAG: hypothetical protein WKF84_19830 [Pyrinomonadaceae bacterium]
MRHLKAHRKLGRMHWEHPHVDASQPGRLPLINARNERIVTTLPKAKELRLVRRAAVRGECAGTRGVPEAGDAAAAQAAAPQVGRRRHILSRRQPSSRRPRMVGKRGAYRVRRVRLASAAVKAGPFSELGDRFKR